MFGAPGAGGGAGAATPGPESGAASGWVAEVAKQRTCVRIV